MINYAKRLERVNDQIALTRRFGCGISTTVFLYQQSIIHYLFLQHEAESRHITQTELRHARQRTNHFHKEIKKIQWENQKP